jgi:hypothetical protein
MPIHYSKRVVFGKSTFCAVVIGNGLLVAGLCFLFTEPVYRERVEELGTNEARMELIYLRALFGIGAFASTFTALGSLWLLGREPDKEPE